MAYSYIQEREDLQIIPLAFLRILWFAVARELDQ